MPPERGVPDLDTWEPPPGILADYERLWLPTSDAPRVYHVACALATVAAAVENKVYLPFGGDRIFPNIWALILGPSSFFRKSSSISKAKRVVNRVNPDALLPDEFSREALLKRLSTRAQGLLTYSEFSGALATFGKDYMSGTKELLTDLYDCPAQYTRVVGQNEFKAAGVCLSILAASQTGWFLEKLKGGDVRGGFLARFCFWPAFEKKRFIAIPPEPDIALWNKITTDLRLLTVMQAKACSLGQDVVGRYTSWLERHERELHGHPRCEDLSPFWSRLSIMTLKFAMLMQLSRDGDSEISLDSLNRAIDLTDFLKRALVHLFAEEFVFTRDQQDRQKVLRHVNQKPGIELRKLYRACSMSKRDMTSALETLVAEDRIRRAVDGKTVMVWPVDDADDGPEDGLANLAFVSATGTDNIKARFSRVK